MVQRLDCRIIKFLCRHCAAFSFCREVVKLAATRLIALHKNKGKSVAACLKSRTDYAQNPDKTQQGELVSSYECSPLTVDEEFMLSKRQYELVTGRRQKSDVIAYQIRQSFKPGEITAEEANKVGYELEQVSGGAPAWVGELKDQIRPYWQKAKPYLAFGIECGKAFVQVIAAAYSIYIYGRIIQDSMHGIKDSLNWFKGLN